nr:MAG TPA: hypothetical protein [Caudoviricetes sp.]
MPLIRNQLQTGRLKSGCNFRRVHFGQAKSYKMANRWWTVTHL